MRDAEPPCREVVIEGVRIKGYGHHVDSWSGVIVFPCAPRFFFEDDDEPDVQRSIAGRQISGNILQEYGISAIGMLPPPGNYHRWRRLMLWESK